MSLSAFRSVRAGHDGPDGRGHRDEISNPDTEERNRCRYESEWWTLYGKQNEHGAAAENGGVWGRLWVLSDTLGLTRLHRHPEWSRLRRGWYWRRVEWFRVRCEFVGNGNSVVYVHDSDTGTEYMNVVLGAYELQGTRSTSTSS